LNKPLSRSQMEYRVATLFILPCTIIFTKCYNRKPRRTQRLPVWSPHNSSYLMNNKQVG